MFLSYLHIFYSYVLRLSRPFKWYYHSVNPKLYIGKKDIPSRLQYKGFPQRETTTNQKLKLQYIEKLATFVPDDCSLIKTIPLPIMFLLSPLPFPLKTCRHYIHSIMPSMIKWVYLIVTENALYHKALILCNVCNFTRDGDRCQKVC